MNKIIFTLLLGMVLLAGVVAASRVITPIDNEIQINDFVAGSNVTAEFGYLYYAHAYDNIDHSPLVIEMNISSLSDSYPVRKGDFQLSGYIEKYTPWYALLLTEGYNTKVNLTCSEDSPLIINSPLGPNTISVPDGIFYCYNTSNDLRLDEGDRVLLNIKSNQALYPGRYNISTKFFYINDTLAPFVNITNKNDFNDKYYRALNNIEVRANITDGSPIADKWGTIFTPTQNITVPFSYENGGIYHFTKVLPTEIPEGNWNMSVFATDTSGNIGNDTVTLRIDNTGPAITLVQPNDSVYSGVLAIEAKITDAKSGVNDSSVQYRLREMNGTNICQGNGVGTWHCYNSGWLSLPHTSGDLFKTDINTTQIGLNGEYWLEIRAHDVLGNEGVLE